jgi:putative transcriptional regulator
LGRPARFGWLRAFWLSLVVLLAPPAHWRAAAQNVDLTGQLLIAPPEIRDWRFQQTVILIVRHDAEGALGIVINKPIGNPKLADVLDSVGQDSAGISGTVRLFYGGPVHPEIGFILHSAEYHGGHTVDIDGRVAMTNSADILRDIGLGRGPARQLVAFGHAGWGPGQLDREMAQGVWFTAPEDPALVFDEDRERVWERALARRTVPL